MVSRHELKRYFWYFFGIAGVVFFWVGIWDGVGYLPYLENPLISLLVGVFMIIISKLIFKDANLFGGDSDYTIPRKVEKAKRKKDKHKYHVKYKDHSTKSEVTIPITKLSKIEKEFIIFDDNGKEFFVPMHRVKDVIKKGKDDKEKKTKSKKIKTKK